MKKSILKHKIDRFLFNFHIKRYPGHNYTIKPSSYIDRRGKQQYNNFSAKSEDTKFNLPIGYCIFYREKNIFQEL